MSKTATKKLKIIDLAKLSGVSKSTVHHYLNIGLLHPANEGLGSPAYDWSHLSQLKRITELRANQKLSLSAIQAILSNEDALSATISRKSAESMINALEEEKRVLRAHKSEMKRVEIMDAAIALFSKIGYEKTTLEAIADSLDIAKSTVYLYFENKENLFMECIERLTLVAVPEEAWDELRREKHPLERLKKRGLAFHKAFPNYKGILTMTKAVMGADNEQLSEKAKNTLFLMTRPMARDIRRGIADGLFRKVDEELVAHFFLAMGEALGFRLMMDSRYTIEQALDVMYDFVSHGLLRTDTTRAADSKTALCPCEVTDLKGMTFSLENICFGNGPYLSTKLGDAEVNIDFNRLKSLKFYGQEGLLCAEVTAKNGQKQKVEVDGALVLSGEVPLGTFSIELKNVSLVLFRSGEPTQALA